MNLNKNRLYLIVGPSGVGKNTLLEGVLDNLDITVAAISITTRDPRPGEVPGVTYNYVTKQDFIGYIANGHLLQYVEYSGNYYGLLRDEIDDKLAAEFDVFAVVEPLGVEQLKDLYPDSLSVFLRPARPDVLIDRMKARGDSEENITQRMKTYNHFMDFMPEADYIVNSGKMIHVLEDVINIIKRNRE